MSSWVKIHRKLSIRGSFDGKLQMKGESWLLILWQVFTELRKASFPFWTSKSEKLGRFAHNLAQQWSYLRISLEVPEFIGDRAPNNRRQCEAQQPLFTAFQTFLNFQTPIIISSLRRNILLAKILERMVSLCNPDFCDVHTDILRLESHF